MIVYARLHDASSRNLDKLTRFIVYIIVSTVVLSNLKIKRFLILVC